MKRECLIFNQQRFLTVQHSGKKQTSQTIPKVFQAVSLPSCWTYFFSFNALKNISSMNRMTSNTPADKSACQQSHTKQYSQLAAACDQSNFRHLPRRYPIRQGSLIKFAHNNSLRWSGQASRPTFIVIPCSVTQSVELQHEMDAAVSPLQVAA